MDMKNWLGLSDSHLSKIDSKHALHPVVIPAFNALQQAAHASSVDLQLVSSYRSFEQQLSIWNRKWHGELPILSARNERLPTKALSDIDKLHHILRWSALPGASRHHWGTDFDVYDQSAIESSNKALQLIDAEYQGNGPCAPLADWLDQHSDAYGFYRPYRTYRGGIGAEPWHLSFRDVSAGIEKQYHSPQLRELIATSEIAGKQIILCHFDEIFYRYVLNKGIPAL